MLSHTDKILKIEELLQVKVSENPSNLSELTQSNILLKDFDKNDLAELNEALRKSKRFSADENMISAVVPPTARLRSNSLPSK